MNVIFLIMIGLSCLSMAQESSRFIKVDGVVTDNKTTLEWQDDYSDNESNIKNTNWVDAIDYCEALTLGGHNDWRLPNKNELLSIVDYGNYNPAISSVFKKTASNYYWSSTTNASTTVFVWLVYFNNGGTGSDSMLDNANIRCVRGG